MGNGSICCKCVTLIAKASFSVEVFSHRNNTAKNAISPMGPSSFNLSLVETSFLVSNATVHRRLGLQTPRACLGIHWHHLIHGNMHVWESHLPQMQHSPVFEPHQVGMQATAGEVVLSNWNALPSLLPRFCLGYLRADLQVVQTDQQCLLMCLLFTTCVPSNC